MTSGRETARKPLRRAQSVAPLVLCDRNSTSGPAIVTLHAVLANAGPPPPLSRVNSDV